MNTTTPVKAYAKREKSAKRTKLYLNEASYANLEYLRGQYAELLGREVSASLITRRAYALLAERMQALRTAGVMEPELAAMATLLLT